MKRVVSSPQPVSPPPRQALLLLCSRELLVASEAYVPAGTSGPTLSTYLLCSRELLVPSRQADVPNLANIIREHSRYVLEVSTVGAAAGAWRPDNPARPRREFPHEPGRVTFGKPHRDQSGPPAFSISTDRRPERAGPRPPSPEVTRGSTPSLLLRGRQERACPAEGGRVAARPRLAPGPRRARVPRLRRPLHRLVLPPLLHQR
jgi:hypothetical protein